MFDNQNILSQVFSDDVRWIFLRDEQPEKHGDKSLIVHSERIASIRLIKSSKHLTAKNYSLTEILIENIYQSLLKEFDLAQIISYFYSFLFWKHNCYFN
jgi:hypothetical protein